MIFHLTIYHAVEIFKALDIEPKVNSIFLHTIEPKGTIIIIISVEIITNTKDIRLVSLSNLYIFLLLMIAMHW